MNTLTRTVAVAGLIAALSTTLLASSASAKPTSLGGVVPRPHHVAVVLHTVVTRPVAVAYYDWDISAETVERLTVHYKDHTVRYGYVKQVGDVYTAWRGRYSSIAVKIGDYSNWDDAGNALLANI